MYRKISRDVKIAAVRLYELGLIDLSDILSCCNFSERTWYRVYRLWKETHDVVRQQPKYNSSACSLHHDDIQYLLCLMRANPDWFLDEFLHLLKTNRFISVHYTTIHRELERANLSRKKLLRVAAERNEDSRAQFMLRMARYAPEELGFIDETSKDERTVGRRYGRSRKGTRCRKKQPFVRGRRTSTEALLSLDGIVACTVVEGSMTKEKFLVFLEHNVVSFSIPTNYTGLIPSAATEMFCVSGSLERSRHGQR
jgi:transposase